MMQNDYKRAFPFLGFRVWQRACEIDGRDQDFQRF